MLDNSFLSMKMPAGAAANQNKSMNMQLMGGASNDTSVGVGQGLFNSSFNDAGEFAMYDHH